MRIWIRCSTGKNDWKRDGLPAPHQIDNRSQPLRAYRRGFNTIKGPDPVSIHPPTTDLAIRTRDIEGFLPLFAAGVQVCPCRGGTIEEILHDDLALSEAYIQNRIQTIFLNGKAVDDLKEARVADSDTLALSAAMPGLVGATFRRGGKYAALRHNVSHRSGTSEVPGETKTITLKLFNLVAKEIGPALLEAGVGIDARRLEDFLSKRSDPFWMECTSIQVDNNRMSRKDLLAALADRSIVSLQVFGP